jgi:serine/threonine protein kinase
MASSTSAQSGGSASPKMMGQYEILGPIGTGGMATVVKAYQPKLDRYVAIKMLHAMFLSDQGFIARFEREARVVASLHHPNIIPLYDYSQDPDTKQPYLVMRLIEGQSLKERLVREGPPPLSATLQIITSIANALTYAHSQGVLHRDVKPSNVILSEDQTPYLMDFGLARMIKAGESTMSADMMIGTPHYISPEQAQGSLILDARTDVYSLGVVLYELVVGRLPFSGDTPFIIVHKHIYEAPTPPREVVPDLPEAVEAVLLKALSKEPEERYASPDELAFAFGEAVQQAGMVELPVAHVQIPEDTAEVFPQGNNTVTLSSVTPATPDAASEQSIGGIRYPENPFIGRQSQRVAIPHTADGNTVTPDRIPLLSQRALQEGVGRFRDAVEDIRQTMQDRERLSSWREIGERAYVEIRAQVEQITDENGQRSWRWPGEPNGPGRMRRPHRSQQRQIEREWGTNDSSLRLRIESQIDERRSLAIHFAVYAIAIGILMGLSPQIQTVASNIFADSSFMQPGTYFPVAELVALVWGGALLAHLLDVIYKTGGWGRRRRQAIALAMERRYGENWQEIATDREYRKARQEAIRPFDERLGFLQHAVVTGGIVGGVFAARSVLGQLLNHVLANTSIPQHIEPAYLLNFLMILMLLPVVIHALVVTLSPIFGSAAKARAIEREYNQQIRTPPPVSEDRLTDMSEKEKRTGVRLTSDGEFTDSMVNTLTDARRDARS